MTDTGQIRYRGPLSDLDGHKCRYAGSQTLLEGLTAILSFSLHFDLTEIHFDTRYAHNPLASDGEFRLAPWRKRNRRLPGILRCAER
jgi:hypothetical protein